ncbi:MAG: ABC transporter ATP-binding protein [Alphaproteobacteria bacterium]|nr:ABC transporter ATP-binding protein [Alphaproteobacteria bacterium]
MIPCENSGLKAQGLSLTATLGGRNIAVLRDVGFSLAPGKVLGLVGESGAGKTMLGRIIARQVPAGFKVSAGSLVFRGTDMLSLGAEAHRALLGDRIAFVPQEPLTALNPVLSIGQQMAEHLARLGVPRTKRQARALELLTEVRLRQPDEVLRKYPFQLSGGMCQRVLLALAFASDPELIIADEPTTALDVMTQTHIVLLLRRLQAARGTAVVFITHDLGLAAHLCDEILVLYAGDVVEQGPAKAIFGAPRHPYTRALHRAIPPLTGPRRRLAALPDNMPGLAAFADLPGCRFAPRCATADPACRAALPPLLEITPGHRIRCTTRCADGIAAAGDGAPLADAPAVAPGMAPLLQLDGVSKTYRARSGLFGRFRPFVALEAVSLSIAPGEFVGIVGESGSGKSTLARLVMGLETPSAGRIVIEGREIAGPNCTGSKAGWAARLHTLQMVFQDPQSALNPRRRVASLTTQALEAGPHRVGRAERHARALELLRETGLAAELAQRFPPQLSGGQRQRVNIARALCATPRLLVADEIVSGLDVSVQAQILNLLLRLREEHGIALLFISHDLSVVRYLCSRVVVMHRGAIVEEGPTEAVFAAPRHAHTRALLAAVPPDDFRQTWPAAGTTADETG